MGWAIGFSEYLTLAGMEDLSAVVANGLLDRRGGGVKVIIHEDELDVLEDFLMYKSIRSRLN